MSNVLRCFSWLLLCPLAIACAAPAPGTATGPQTLRALYGVAPLTSIERSSTALVLVDFQREFFDGALALPDGDRALGHAGALLAWARREELLTVHVRNIAKLATSPVFRAGSHGAAIMPALTPAPGDVVITKAAAGAFTHTELDATLRSRGIRTLVVAGLMTHLAVDSTARDAALLGYAVLIASDATATRALPDPDGGQPVGHGQMQRAALAALADRFAQVAASRAILALRITP